MRTFNLRVMQIINISSDIGFSNKMFMFFFLLRFINSTIIFEQVVEVLDNGSLCAQALDIWGGGEGGGQTSIKANASKSLRYTLAHQLKYIEISKIDLAL